MEAPTPTASKARGMFFLLAHWLAFLIATILSLVILPKLRLKALDIFTISETSSGWAAQIALAPVARIPFATMVMAMGLVMAWIRGEVSLNFFLFSKI